MKKLFIILFLFGIILNSNATVYYFDATLGNDSNTGTTEGSPFKSVSKMQTIINSLAAGDEIRLKRGEVWYEVDLSMINRVGTSGSPIRIRAYGSGAMPILSGEKVLSGGVLTGNIYKYVDADLPSIELTSASYGRRFLGGVAVNDVYYAPARYPNEDDESPYLYSDATGSTSLTDNGLTWETNEWRNGFIGVKNVHWQWSVARVLSNDAHTLSTTAHITTASIGSPTGPKYYYFLNAYAALDKSGEWFWNNDTLYVYWTGTTPEVRASISDAILDIVGSDYVYIDSVVFQGANHYGIKRTDCDYNKIDYCKFQGIGEFGVYTFGKWTNPWSGDPGLSETNEITNCEFVDVQQTSIFYRGAKGGLITNNYIHRNSINNAYQNIMQDEVYHELNGYAIAVRINLTNPLYCYHNIIDSTAAGIMTHNNGATVHFRENLIQNYGLTELSDIGAFYVVSDREYNDGDITKNFSRNIVVDGYSPLYTPLASGNYTDYFTHAVYFDQDSHGARADSNSIETTGNALSTNGGRYRRFTYNKIVNANAWGFHDAHASVIRHSYNIPLQDYDQYGTQAGYDTIMYNTMAEGDNSSIFYTFLRPTLERPYYPCYHPLYSRLDYNNYHRYVWSSTSDVAEIFDKYNVVGAYNLNEWKLAQWSCSGTIYDPGEHDTYTSHTRQDAKLFKNFSDGRHSFDLGATYVDESGNTVSGSVVVPPFYSKMLFPTSTGYEYDVDLYIDTTIAPFYSAVEEYIEDTYETDTIFFKDYSSGVNIATKLSSDCADSAIYRYISGGTGEGATDTIAYLNFAYYNNPVSGWTELDGMGTLADSVEIATNIWFVNTSKLTGANTGMDYGSVWPFEVSYYAHYIPAADETAKTYIIRGSGLTEAGYKYKIGVLSSHYSATTRYLVLDVGGVKDSVNASYNYNNTANVGDITATDNRIDISFTKSDGVTAYINGLFLIRTESTSAGSSDPSYVRFNNINFGLGVDSIMYAVDFNQSVGTKSFELRLGGVDGQVIDSFMVDAPGCSIRKAAIPIELSGIQNLYANLDTLDEYSWMKFYSEPIIGTEHDILDTFKLYLADELNTSTKSYDSDCGDTTVTLRGYALFENVNYSHNINRVDIKLKETANVSQVQFYIDDGTDRILTHYATTTNTSCNVITLKFDDFWPNEISDLYIRGNLALWPYVEIDWMVFYYVPKKNYLIHSSKINGHKIFQ